MFMVHEVTVLLWDRVGLNVGGWGGPRGAGHVIHNTNPYIHHN